MARIFDITKVKSDTHVLDSASLSSFQQHTDCRCTRLLTIICAVTAAVFILLSVVLATILAVGGKKESFNTRPFSFHPNHEPQWPQPSGSLYGQFKKAAIATDHGLCSEIGRNILFAGGNAIDATIASLICIGVVNPQNSGLGGGFLMTVYNRTTGKCITLNARESAPASSSTLMFAENASEATVGYKSIAIPTELHGLWTAFRKFSSGKVSWKQLIQPSIDLAIKGFPVSSNLALILKRKERQIMDEKSLRAVFVNPNTGKVYEEGDRLTRYSLGQTLQMIANASDPNYLFYKGEIAKIIVSEMKENGGIITAKDLYSYNTIIETSPIQVPLPSTNLIMCGPPPPSSFAVTQLIVSILAEFYMNGQPVDLNDPLVYHRLIEAEKFGYAHRSQLGDLPFVKEAQLLINNMTTSSYAKWIKSLIKDVAQPIQYYMKDAQYQKPDHGTSHVSVIDEDGNAVSTTDTINLRLGSLRVSPILGIVWNNEMDDFSTPGLTNAFNIAPSEANFIRPNKRPMSSMSPTIIYDKTNGKVRMSIGASGGSFIISATAQGIIRSLIFNQTIKESVDTPRLHNQFLPHVTQYEETFPQQIVDELRYKHKQSMESTGIQASVVQVIEAADDGFLYGNSDFRRKTSTHAAGY
uniref:Gamma-glutamyltranspeptidase 1 n=1 Tax=Syphacia muris TaxID=451379 RepID=A0A0N5AJW6_9BILA